MSRLTSVRINYNCQWTVLSWRSETRCRSAQNRKAKEAPNFSGWSDHLVCRARAPAQGASELPHGAQAARRAALVRSAAERASAPPTPPPRASAPPTPPPPSPFSTTFAPPPYHHPRSKSIRQTVSILHLDSLSPYSCVTSKRSEEYEQRVHSQLTLDPLPLDPNS